jgi:lambda family phage portal protein
MSAILDSNGRPMTTGAPANRRSSASLDPQNQSVFPYTAAAWQTQEMGDWQPWIRSPDAEINQFRDRMVARSRDLVRNDGWASGGVMRILDNTVGTHLRLAAKPDYRALQIRFGKKFDAVWAEEFQRAAEALWRGFSEHVGRYNDVNRSLTVGQMFRLAMRHKLVDGDALAISYWMPERVGYGGSDYATSFLLVDPDRLGNPYGMLDTKYMRGGVEIDDNGVAQALHIRQAEQNDWYNAVEANTWERIECEDDDGWRRVILDFERDRAGQHRGIGVFTPVIARFKMLARYYGVELQAATIASAFGTYVVSPYDPAQVGDALASDDELSRYQQLRTDFHKERPAMLDGARVPTLAPGEKIETVASAHPHTGFTDFAHEMLRTFAAAAGISAEQVTQDWSKTNYSSARAALMESWKTLVRRRTEFSNNFASPMYAVWLQEAMDKGELPLPSGAPDFVEAATAYARCGWLGPARGWIDPVKEKAGAVMGMDAGLSTLMSEAAEQGNDWEEVLDQRSIEVKKFKELGLPLPDWIGAVSAAEAARPEETPQPR